MATATPGSLVRWHYLWYVAAALAVMIVAITSRHLWLLNFVHVLCSLLWTGIDLFMGFVLGPILRRLDIGARRDIARRLTPRTLFLMPTVWRDLPRRPSNATESIAWIATCRSLHHLQ